MILQGSKVLITGGSGFVGSHIVDQLLLEKVGKIIILDNFIRGVPENLSHVKNNKKVKIINGDIRDVKLVDKLCKGVDFISHQAAIRLLKCTEDPRLCHEVMVDGTFNILEASIKHKIKKIIVASSVSVYGEPSYLPIDEAHPYNNTTLYGAAKIANEHLSMAFHYTYNLSVIILRYFNAYGERMDILGNHREVFIKWLDRIDQGESPVIHGDGKQALDFVNVLDIAKANILALKSDVSFGIYNIGTGRTTSLLELANLLIKLSKSDLKVVFEKSVNRPNIKNREADVLKAKRELNFKAKITIEEGLTGLIEWRRKRLKQI